jgi:ssDNA-specific exonuclease RecJ
MTKNKLSIAPPDKKKTLEAFFRYYELSRLLFGQKQNEIYDVTDIPKTNKFYELAKEIAKQLEIDWENMTHEEVIVLCWPYWKIHLILYVILKTPNL